MYLLFQCLRDKLDDLLDKLRGLPSEDEYLARRWNLQPRRRFPRVVARSPSVEVDSPSVDQGQSWDEEREMQWQEMEAARRAEMDRQ
ncbi:unnamed protein product [Amoebophrya sp. A120]|nr:unnamed protein product [Amoebophrya sp. A120]|eukprot:GSA120T00025082001.1